MLFAVAATTAGTAHVVTTGDRPPETVEAVVHEVKEQPVDIALPQRPLVLPTGAPACGNVMTKFAALGDPCTEQRILSSLKL